VHNTLELPRSLFEVITFWTGGMLRILLLGRVLRACVAPQGFALGSSPRWLFACGGSDGGRRSLGRCKIQCIIGIISLPASPKPCQYENVRPEQVRAPSRPEGCRPPWGQGITNMRSSLSAAGHYLWESLGTRRDGALHFPFSLRPTRQPLARTPASSCSVPRPSTPAPPRAQGRRGPPRARPRRSRGPWIC
jgi:hypothetical protein